MVNKKRPKRRIIKVHGSPYDCGRMIGEASGSTIQACYDIHCREYQTYLDAWDTLCQTYKSQIATIAPRAAEELRGVADGSGLSLDVMVKMSCLEELDQYVSAYPWCCHTCSKHIEPYKGLRCVECAFALCDNHSSAAALHPHPMERVKVPKGGAPNSRGKALGLPANTQTGHCTAFAATEKVTNKHLPEGITGQTLDWAPQMFSHAMHDTVWFAPSLVLQLSFEYVTH